MIRARKTGLLQPNPAIPLVVRDLLLREGALNIQDVSAIITDLTIWRAANTPKREYQPTNEKITFSR